MNQQGKGLSEVETLQIINDLVQGLLHLHIRTTPISYRDLNVIICQFFHNFL